MGLAHLDEFVNFIYFLKELAFSFVDFCYGLLCFFFIYFWPNFKISFLLLTLVFFISSFLVGLGVELGYLFEIFLVSWGKTVLL